MGKAKLLEKKNSAEAKAAYLEAAEILKSVGLAQEAMICEYTAKKLKPTAAEKRLFDKKQMSAELNRLDHMINERKRGSKALAKKLRESAKYYKLNNSVKNLDIIIKNIDWE